MGINADLGEILQLGRSIKLETPYGLLVYNDQNKKYEPIVPLQQPVGQFTRTVSNVESFVAYVSEEARRRDNPNGDKITITFGSDGGYCRLADGDKLDSISYKRSLSPQWNFLTQSLNRPLAHKDLLRVLQCLRPSFFDGYDDFMKAYRKITFDASVNVTSQPFIEDGTKGSTINFQFSVASGGNGKATLPAQLLLQLQYARGSSRNYTALIEIDSELREKKEDKKEIVFTLALPDIDNIIADAIRDEVADFKTAISEKLPAALVVLNF